MIRVLPEALVREIAAGEVITRPEDVVKELVENALDAGATRVLVELVEGGIARVLVSDDGAGIPREELPLAVERHTTSKLEDLSRVTTLGFRGEGLYALRQAARVRITSRPRGQLGGATLIAEGERIELYEHAAPAGTEVEVTRLFSRLPARRAALEGPASEGRRAAGWVYRYLLHYPGVAWRLLVDGEERLVFPGGSFAEAAQAAWGKVVANRLIEVGRDAGDYRVAGVLSRPELARSRRDRLLLAVNGRPVAWPEELLAAVVRAYRELLPTGQYPLGVINLRLPPEEVLVNTDPRKTRVRLLEPRRAAEFLEEAVVQALSAHPLAAPLPGPERPRPVAGPARGSFPRLRFLAPFRDLYLLAESGDELWIVDQHAAHERVIYEELLRRFEEEPPQELKEPLLLALGGDEVAAALGRREELAAHGLVVEPFGEGHLRVLKVPAVFSLAPELLPELVREFLREGEILPLVRRVLGRLACLPAVRAGHRLSGASAQALLDALAACRTPWVCPHGRPTALVVTEAELARRFGRRSARQQVARPSGQVGEGADVYEPEPQGEAAEEGGVGGVELEEDASTRP